MSNAGHLLARYALALFPMEAKPITVLPSSSFLRKTIASHPDRTLTGDSSLGSQDLLLPVLVERAMAIS
jgi:hypothetical protein